MKISGNNGLAGAFPARWLLATLAVCFKIYQWTVQWQQDNRECVAEMLKTDLKVPFHIKEKG